MFPLADNIPHRRKPIVNWLLIAANVAIFVLMVTTPIDRQDAAYERWGVVAARFALPEQWTYDAALKWARQSPPLVTSQFMHAGWLHLILNMWALWIFGDNVEDRMGHVRFALFYLTCGVVAAATHVAMSRGSTIPMVGASGAIAGVLGAYLFLFPRSRLTVLLPILIYPLFFKMPAVAYLILWFALQLLGGLASRAEGADAAGVAWWAHVGGFAMGVVLLPLCTWPWRWRANPAGPGIVAHE